MGRVSRKLKSIKIEYSTLILAFVFSLFSCSGYIYIHQIQGAFGKHRYLTLFVFLCLFVTFYLGIGWLGRRRLKEKEIRPIAWKLIPVILIISWLPYWLYIFPGSFSNDVTEQILQVFHIKPLSNHNPVLDTWIFGALFKFGRAVTGIDNAGIVTIIIFEMLLMAFAFTYGIYQGYELTKSRDFVLVAAAFYAVIPMFGCAAHTVLKDTLHMPIFVFMIGIQISLIRKPTKGKCILYAVSIILVSLTRAMAFLYACIGGAIFLVFFWKKKMDFRRLLVVAVTAAVVFVILWENVFLSMFGVKKYPSVEKYSAPLYQIAYVVCQHDLTEEETEAINSFLDVDLVRHKYDPDIIDEIKVMYHGETPAELWKIYRAWWKKYPKDMIWSFGRSYYKYVYPPAVGSRNGRFRLLNLSKYGLHTHLVVDESYKTALRVYLEKVWSKYTVLRLFFGPGLYSWVLLFGLQQCIRKRSRNVIHLIPLLVLFIGLFLTPVNGEMRYAYPVLASAPIVIALAYENVMEKSRPDAKELSAKADSAEGSLAHT